MAQEATTEKVTADKAAEKIKEVKEPGWQPRTMGEIALSQRLALAEDIIARQEGVMSQLKTSNTEHLRNLASLTGQVEVLTRVCKGYEEEMSALKATTTHAVADAERDTALIRALLTFIRAHPAASGIDFAPLFSA